METGNVQSDNNIKDFSNLNFKQKFAYAMRCITGDKNGFWLGKFDKWKSSESTLGKRGAKLVLSLPKERERVVDKGFKDLVKGKLDTTTRSKLFSAAYKLENGNVFQRRQAYKEFRSIEKQIMTDFENKKPLTLTNNQIRNFGFGLFGKISTRLSIKGLEGEFYKQSEQPDADFNELKGTTWDFKPGNPPSLSVSKEVETGGVLKTEEVHLQDIKFKSKTDENGNKEIIASFKDPINTNWVLEAEVPDYLFKDDLAKLKTQILNAGEGGCYIGEDGAVKPLSTESNNVEVRQEPDVQTNEGNNVQTLDDSVIKETSATSQDGTVIKVKAGRMKKLGRSVVKGVTKFGTGCMNVLGAIGNAFSNVGKSILSAMSRTKSDDGDFGQNWFNNESSLGGNDQIQNEVDDVWAWKGDENQDEIENNFIDEDPFAKDFEEGF